jgi:hypothetical protein
LTEIPYVSPEDKIKRDQERIAETKALVEADKLKRRLQREEIQKQQAAIAKLNVEEEKRKAEDLIARQTVGMSDAQVKIYRRLMQLEPLLQSSAGDQKQDVKAEYDILLSELIKEGRTVGSVSFVPQTIWVSTSGHGLIDTQGRYHQGVLGSYETTSWLLKEDPKTHEPYLGRIGNIDHTNLLIEDRLVVVILDKFPDPVPNIKHPPLFPKKQELSEPRPVTPKEIKEKRKRFF